MCLKLTMMKGYTSIPCNKFILLQNRIYSIVYSIHLFVIQVLKISIFTNYILCLVGFQEMLL